MACRLGWGWLPLSVFLLMTTGILVSYLVAVLLGHVDALLPYISDTGADLPESAIFAQFLNMAGCVAGVTLFMRYKVIHDLTGSAHQSLNRLAAVSLALGMLASFGLSVVGNFQDDKIPAIHFTGAALVFGLGGIYCYLDTIATYKMAPRYNDKYIGHIRLSISILGSIGLLLAAIGRGVSHAQWKGRTEDQSKHWKPTDPGYQAHLVSTFGEWFMAAGFILYFFAQIWDFRKVKAKFHVEVTVRHLSHQSPLDTTDELQVSTDTQSEPNETTGLFQA